MKSLIITAVVTGIISMFASPIFACTWDSFSKLYMNFSVIGIDTTTHVRNFPVPPSPNQHRSDEYKEYRVYVKHIRSSYYQDQYTGMIIQAHLCLSSGQEADAILLWCGKNHPGCGELIFRSGNRCEVVGVHYPKSLPFLFKPL